MILKMQRNDGRTYEGTIESLTPPPSDLTTVLLPSGQAELDISCHENGVLIFPKHAPSEKIFVRYNSIDLIQTRSQGINIHVTIRTAGSLVYYVYSKNRSDNEYIEAKINEIVDHVIGKKV